MEICELVTVILLLYVGIKIGFFVWFMLRCHVLPKFGFVVDLRKFGEWAVVTGATDGIGKAYAQEFAKRGLNVVLIGRNEDKLDIVANQITEDFNVKAETIVHDFCDADGYTELDQLLNDLDVGVLVNNVGMSGQTREFFDKLNIQDVYNVAHVNMFGELKMTHMVIKGMVKRKRGVVVHISSGFGFVPMPMMGIYSHTKAFVNSFTKALEMENEAISDLHHQLVTPSFVASNMTKMKPSLSCPSSSDYATSAVNTIGLASETCGYWVHELHVILRPVQLLEWLLLKQCRHVRLTKRIEWGMTL